MTHAVDFLDAKVNQPLFFMNVKINGQQATLKKGYLIEYVSKNRIFTDADDYSMEIELPLADCPQNLVPIQRYQYQRAAEPGTQVIGH